MTTQQAYRLLGLKENASNIEIKKAYFKKAKQYHPDVSSNRNAQELFIQVVEAYEILTISGRKQKRFHPKSETSNAKSNFHFRNTTHQHKNYRDFTKEEFDEYYQSAKRRYEKNFERQSQKIYHDNFEEYKSGYKRKIAMAMAILGILLSIIFSFDHYQKPIDEPIDMHGIKYTFIFSKNNINYYTFTYHNQQLLIDNISLHTIAQSQTPNKLKVTPIFHDIKGLYNGNSNKIMAEQRISIHKLFFVFIALFLLPSFILFFEKPSFNFVFFGIYYSIFAFPILVIYLMFNDLRLIRFIETLFN